MKEIIPILLRGTAFFAWSVFSDSLGEFILDSVFDWEIFKAMEPAKKHSVAGTKDRTNCETPSIICGGFT
jgi:hypothetical protein